MEVDEDEDDVADEDDEDANGAERPLLDMGKESVKEARKGREMVRDGVAAPQWHM
jgi:hypothetical protein